jgi:hypothetical protein
MDSLRRLQALEQGAAGRPGPGVADGSVTTSDTTQTGGVRWGVDRGSEVAAPTTATSNFSTGSLAAGAYSAAAITALTITGNNVNAVLVEFWASGTFLGGGTAAQHGVTLHDGSIGAGTIVAIGFPPIPSASAAQGPVLVRARIAAFSGSKTFNIAVRNDGGVAQTISIAAGSTYPTMLRAVWC